MGLAQRRKDAVRRRAVTRSVSSAALRLRDNALVAQKAGVKTLVLTHLLAQTDQPCIREQIVHEIQQTFTGKVVWGEDLMKIGFVGPSVSNIESGY